MQLHCFLGSRLRSSLKVLQRAMMGRKMVEIKLKGKEKEPVDINFKAYIEMCVKEGPDFT